MSEGIPFKATIDNTRDRVPTLPAWCGCRRVSTATSRTCEEPGWGQAAWQPGRPPAGVDDRTPGAPWCSSTHTGRRNTRSPLERRELEFSVWPAVGRCLHLLYVHASSFVFSCQSYSWSNSFLFIFSFMWEFLGKLQISVRKIDTKVRSELGKKAFSVFPFIECFPLSSW